MVSNSPILNYCSNYILKNLSFTLPSGRQQTFSRGIRRVRTNLKRYVVVHNKEESKFSIELDEDEAYIDYDLDDNVYELLSANVPDDYGGQGIGRILAEQTFDMIIKSGGKIKLSCSFLEGFYEKNYSKYKRYVID